MTSDQAIARLRAQGLSENDAAVVVEHLATADRMGRTGHGLSRIDWLEGLLVDTIDPTGRPQRVDRSVGFERWHGGGALGYLTLAAICDGLIGDPPSHARLVVAEACFPSGVLGAWARRLAGAGLATLRRS